LKILIHSQSCIRRIIERLPLPPIQTWGKLQELNTVILTKNMTYLQNSKIIIHETKDVAKVFVDLLALEDKIDQDKEHFYVMHLDVKSRVKLVELVSLGTLNASLVHPRETFRRAVMQGSANIIVAHNHPSGEVEPSDEDAKITKVLHEAGNILGITLLDHIIFTNEKLFSFRENREEKIEKINALEKGKTYE
jgi:DNA repair protein RadC